jgi:hypothetical protein
MRNLTEVGLHDKQAAVTFQHRGGLNPQQSNLLPFYQQEDAAVASSNARSGFQRSRLPPGFPIG